MAIAADGKNTTGENVNYSLPDPVITYDHISGHESRRYFDLRKQAVGVTLLWLIMEELLLAIMVITLFMLS